MVFIKKGVAFCFLIFYLFIIISFSSANTYTTTYFEGNGWQTEIFAEADSEICVRSDCECPTSGCTGVGGSLQQCARVYVNGQTALNGGVDPDSCASGWSKKYLGWPPEYYCCKRLQGEYHNIKTRTSDNPGGWAYYIQGCISQYSTSCYNGHVYWYDSCGNRETKKEDCGTTSWTGGNYCLNGHVYRDRIKRGCNGNSCYVTYESVKQEDCGTLGCLNGVCNQPPTCSDECSAGTKRCIDGIKSTCGNYDSDPCLEWGGNIDCGEGCTSEGIGGDCAQAVCSDSDGGKNYLVKGTTIFDSLVNYVYEIDECLDGNTLREWYCPGVNLAPRYEDVKCYDYLEEGAFCSLGQGICRECLSETVECGDDGCGNIMECSDINHICRNNSCVPAVAYEQYYWTDSSSNEITLSSIGGLVISVAETSLSQDVEFILEIREDDRFLGFGSTEFIKNVSVRTDENGIAKYLWNIDSEDFEDIEENDDTYEVYFVAHVDGRRMESSILRVKIPELCISTYGEEDKLIEYCADYTPLKDNYDLDITKEQCNLDCNDAHLNDREIAPLKEPNEDGCAWDNTQKVCRYWQGAGGGGGGSGCTTSCIYQTISEGNCDIETGLRKIEQSIWFKAEDCNEYTFEEFSTEFQGRVWECNMGVNEIPCARSIQLNFFGFMGLLIASLLISIIYLSKSKKLIGQL